ncbi:MAG: tRNA (guanosine(37)-N1)-methyltransferase TrmD [Candidatus Omnitrophica bacterium]|nr:tRNA (guanosine(37)-N1)-methyltransferase TrmD [Candidatus Omnitrophota bacterium]
MRIDILTLFPKMFENILGESILKRAQDKGKVKILIHNLRDWTFDSHKSADDKPFGGGPGMVMKVEPVYLALEELKAREKRQRARVILLTPQGKKLDQKLVKKLSKEKRLILICGHYEGVDERIRNLVDDEISIGDYILTCGEIPALVLIDSITRLIPGVLGGGDSLKSESFEKGLLEYPQYTRPADFNGMKVPQTLLSGDHRKIEIWRREEAVKRTRERRPDLIKIERERYG